MTFNDNADISSGKVTRRGRNTAIGVGGGGGVVAIIVLLISAFTGTDLTGLLGGGGPAGPDEQLNCTAAEANTDIDCRVQGATAAIDAYWVKKAPDLGITYATPSVDIFSGQVQTGCGLASTAVGPFYCPPDQGIYLDTSFYQQLEQQFGASAGSLAQMYVMSHEWGHAIQARTGVFDIVPEVSTPVVEVPVAPVTLPIRKSAFGTPVVTVHVNVAPGASEATTGHTRKSSAVFDGVPLSSVRVTFSRRTRPVFVTTYL